MSRRGLLGSGAENGYAMAALLVALAVMSVVASTAMPVWQQLSQREKEAELIFRGEQYARAVDLFQRKMGPGTLPPSLDILVEQRFLRKRYIDPITGEAFQLLYANQPAGAQGQGLRNQTDGPSRAPSPQRGSARSGDTPIGMGGITGVVSKSKDRSIRLYNERSTYDQWLFMHVAVSQAPGIPTGSGQPGWPGGLPGGVGGPALPGGNRPGAGRLGSGRLGQTPPTNPSEGTRPRQGLPGTSGGSVQTGQTGRPGIGTQGR
jgi:type II secretory pathway pseudopilin PulG